MVGKAGLPLSVLGPHPGRVNTFFSGIRLALVQTTPNSPETQKNEFTWPNDGGSSPGHSQPRRCSWEGWAGGGSGHGQAGGAQAPAGGPLGVSLKASQSAQEAECLISKILKSQAVIKMMR